MARAVARHQQEALYLDKLINERVFLLSCLLQKDIIKEESPEKRAVCCKSYRTVNVMLSLLLLCGQCYIDHPHFYMSHYLIKCALWHCLKYPLWSSTEGLQSTSPVNSSLLLLQTETMWLRAENLGLKTESLTKLLLDLRVTSHLLSNIHVKDIFNEKTKPWVASF